MIDNMKKLLPGAARYFMEKRTREQYAKEKFKKKYNFKPTDSTGRSGYITVDGEKHKVHLSGKYKSLLNGKPVLLGVNSINNKSAYDNTNQTRIIAGDNDPLADKATGDMMIDPNFFKLKGGKRRDAVLQHEIGHKKLHVQNRFSKYPQKAQYLAYANRVRLSQKYGNKAKRVIRRNDGKSEEFIPSHRTHYTEFEADRYAANRVGKKYVKRATRNLHKLNNKSKRSVKGVLKDIKYTNNYNNTNPDPRELKKPIAKDKANANDDMRRRSRALNDKFMQITKLYR